MLSSWINKLVNNILIAYDIIKNDVIFAKLAVTQSAVIYDVINQTFVINNSLTKLCAPMISGLRVRKRGIFAWAK